MDELKYWVALSAIPQLGAARFRRLESYFGNLEHAWRAGASQLRDAGLDSRTAQGVVAARQQADPDDSMESLALAGVSATNWNCDDYPPRLKQIADPPPVLYYLGTIVPKDECSVAIVGTRNPTSYGREAAAVLGRDLASAGITVVSGLALGIDGAAHRAALECGGRTIAVVAGGLDSVYPKEHSGLFRQIQSRGAVVSEHRLGVRPDARNFPRRNRLISGMTLGTVVVEAAEGSGTRWTVQQALEQNREVFCVPGSIFSPASRFTNRMIKEGAKLVADYTDVLEELNLPDVGQLSVSVRQRQDTLELDDTTESIDTIPEEAQEDLDDGEIALLAHLTGAPAHVDNLCRQSGIPIHYEYVDVAGTEREGYAGRQYALYPGLRCGGDTWQLSPTQQQARPLLARSPRLPPPPARSPQLPPPVERKPRQPGSPGLPPGPRAARPPPALRGKAKSRRFALRP